MGNERQRVTVSQAARNVGRERERRKACDARRLGLEAENDKNEKKKRDERSSKDKGKAKRIVNAGGEAPSPNPLPASRPPLFFT